MKKYLNILGLLIILSITICGAFQVGYELKKGADVKSHRERVRFERDSLQVEFYKNELKK